MSKKQSKEEKKSLQIQLVTQMITLSTSGFGVVAALAWNSLIQEFINSYIKRFLPDGSGLVSLVIYAIAVTCLAVTVTLQLSKLKESLEK